MLYFLYSSLTVRAKGQEGSDRQSSRLKPEAQVQKRRFMMAYPKTDEELQIAVVGYYEGQNIYGEQLSRWAYDKLLNALKNRLTNTPHKAQPHLP